MAWREDETRATLIRDAAARLTPGKAPAAFADAMFGQVTPEDLANHDAASIAFLAESAWEHVQKRTPGRADIRIFNPQMPDGREITVIEVLNDNMPFLFDSTMSELAEQGVEVGLVAHPIIAVDRDADGNLVHFNPEFRADPSAAPTKKAGRESLIHIHATRIDDEETRAKVAAALTLTLEDVRAAVTDWKPMRERVLEAAGALSSNPPPNLPAEEVSEAVELLNWLCGDNFVFLGVREYRFESEDIATANVVEKQGFGVLRDPNLHVLRRGREFVVMTPEMREFLLDDTALIVAKANVKSRVHRRIHMDYVAIKLFDEQGRLKGGLRVVGLFTVAAYTRSVRQIPYIRHKVAQVLARAGFDPESHSGKAMLNILEAYPRDELVQVDVDTLYNFAMDILLLYERPRLRAMVRVDKFDRFVSVLVFIPREKYDTNMRVAIGNWLAEAYKGRLSASYASFPEGPLARVHYIIGRYEGATPVIARDDLEAKIGELASSWGDKLRSALGDSYGGLKARQLGNRYAGAFTGGYTELFDSSSAIADIAIAEKLGPDRKVALTIYRREGRPDSHFHLKFFAFAEPLSLSWRVPVVENHGLRVVNERTYRIEPRGGENLPAIYLHDMSVASADGAPVTLDQPMKERLQASIMAVVNTQAESDGYNALILNSSLAWREVAALRTLSRYLRQIRIPFSQDYMWGTLARNPAIATLIVDLLSARFNADKAATQSEREAAEASVVAEIEQALEKVDSLDEDRILRRFTNLVQAAMRTNFWQVGKDGQPRETITFKFSSRKIEKMPAPAPLFEIFVYSPRVEGVHLRFGRVARGGLRWSDRPQDFRTEVLGLVKAQQVKNAVIVPVGAKGGFVPKWLPPQSQRDAWLAEGTEAYRIFIRSLLDLTDNIDGDDIVPPANTVRHDGDDPYLVVAADKGTATFSDIANAISAEKGHWLGDAFASGGSQGYDHKGMGITARGAWEAVKRHFRELGTDIQTQPFTAVGVGDMSGDVFGNGMLLSPQTRLIAAFDHRDIFLDPDPDAASSHAERQRMFALPRSSWADYDKSLISAGGGVFPRSLKSIKLTPQVRQALSIDKAEVTPIELITAILKAPVDLLWFGGIGTYVRSSAETDDQAGDRANDPVRITGAEVGAKVVGEGANLGMTQRGRIEAANKGVRINTDAIDNSAGVNTSDVEVNIKIALTRPERDGRLDYDGRNALLTKMTGEVADLVLRNNYLQTLALSLAERNGSAENGFLVRLMQSLEQRGLLDRAVEYLPDDQTVAERSRRGASFTRPELAVLLAYAKLTMHSDLLETNVPDDPYLAQELVAYFPSELRDNYKDAIENHRLRRDIIATALANSIINRCGPAGATRLIDETGADVSTVVLAYAAVRDVFGTRKLTSDLDALDNVIDGGLQLQLYAEVQELTLARMIWFIRNIDLTQGLDAVVSRFSKAIEEVRRSLDASLSPDLAAARTARREELIAAGVPEAVAADHADLLPLSSVPGIMLVAERTDRNISDASATWFATAATFRLDAVANAARTIVANDYFERVAIDRTIEQISGAERRLLGDILKTGKTGKDAVDAWLETHPASVRIRRNVDEIVSSGLTLAKLTVAADQLNDLVRA